MIQIDFFDKDIVSTLLPISTMKPDKVYFLIDKRSITGRDPENTSRAINNMLPDTEIEYIPVTVDDLSDIYEKLKALAEALVDRSDACIDLTGGTELMSACGYRISKEYDVLPIYVDVRREHVINAETGEIIKPINHISLEDCLTIIGAKRLRDSHDLPKEEEFDSIINVCNVVFKHVDDWQKICQHISNTVASAVDQMHVRIPEKVGKTRGGEAAVINALLDNGFLTKVEDGQGISGKYKFPSRRVRSYITTFGTWLELFIYIHALRVYDEAALGVVIDWYEGDNLDTQDNEIDVVAMKRSVPIFISCKMRKPVSGDLYEVGYVASMLGGNKSKALLATTYPVKELGTSPKRMYQRMKKFRVGLIEASRFEELPAADVFTQAIQMTE